MPHIQRGIVPTRKTRRNVPLNLETEIKQQVSQLQGSPFVPEFGEAPKFVAPERPRFRTDQKVPFLADLESSIADIRGRETVTTPEELAGLKGLFATADPTLRLQKAQEFINKIVGPRNEAAAIAAGFGRGPAALEATTRAGAELALPIVTESGRQQAIANQFKIALSQASQARGVSRDRAVFEAVAAKVRAGQNTESLNAQERSVLAQFNLSAAGSESQFNLNAAGLQSEQEINRANIGLSTQDRTIALLNQLRQIRTSQAGINAGLVTRGGGRAGGSGGTPSLTGAARTQGNFQAGLDLEQSRISAFERQAGFDRQAAERTARDARLAANPLGGVLTGGGGATTTTGGPVVLKGNTITNAPSSRTRSFPKSGLSGVSFF